MAGQITQNSILGCYIYNCVKQRDIVTIVDIGTHDGLGSTNCIYESITDYNKQNYHVYSIEANETMYKQAVNNLPPLKNFELINGTVVDRLKPFEQYNQSHFSHSPSIVVNWYYNDLECINNAPKIKLPYMIDLLILDGGEFSSLLEYDMLAERSKIIVLDDTLYLKNKENRQKALADKNLRIVIDITNHLEGRNGYSVFERVT